MIKFLKQYKYVILTIGLLIYVFGGAIWLWSQKHQYKRKASIAVTTNSKLNIEQATVKSVGDAPSDEVIKEHSNKQRKKSIPAKVPSTAKPKDDVELSVDKLSVLPTDEQNTPQVEAVGSVEIQLDKPKKQPIKANK